MKILIINGPNINMLGIREPSVYGTETYDTLCKTIRKYAGDKKIEAEIYQSNHEGDLIDEIQKAYYDKADGLIINPGAYTHTSIAISDALKAVNIPTVEVHLSDISRREEYRRHSYVKGVAIKTIMGKGISGYTEAIDFLLSYKENK